MIVFIYVAGNLIWFGMWMYVVFGLHQSPWWMAVPILLHFTMETLKGKGKNRNEKQS